MYGQRSLQTARRISDASSLDLTEQHFNLKEKDTAYNTHVRFETASAHSIWRENEKINWNATGDREVRRKETKRKESGGSGGEKWQSCHVNVNWIKRAPNMSEPGYKCFCEVGTQLMMVGWNTAGHCGTLQDTASS